MSQKDLSILPWGPKDYFSVKTSVSTACRRKD